MRDLYPVVGEWSKEARGWIVATFIKALHSLPHFYMFIYLNFYKFKNSYMQKYTKGMT